MVGDLVGDRAQAVPEALRQRGGRVEHEPQPREERLGQRAVGLEARREQRVAGGHVVVDGRGDLAQRARPCASNSAGTGLPSSMCSVPPNASTWPRLWLPPNVWLHGSQSTSTGGSARMNGHTWPSACWLEHSIRCVLITPFGAPVDPEVNRIFATVSGPSAANARSTSAPGLGRLEVGERERRRPRSPATTTGTRRRRPSSAGAERAAVVGEDHAGRAQAGDRADALVVAAEQRVGRAERDDGDAGGVGAEQHQQCSIELPDRIISGRSGPRPCSRSACAIASARARAAPQVSVSQPVAAERPLRRQHAVRMRLRPGPEQVRHARRVLARRVGGADEDRAVRAALGDDPRRREHVHRGGHAQRSSRGSAGTGSSKSSRTASKYELHAWQRHWAVMICPPHCPTRSTVPAPQNGQVGDAHGSYRRARGPTATSRPARRARSSRPRRRAGRRATRAPARAGRPDRG